MAVKSKGVYKAVKKDGSTHFRVSITYKMKHISLGSFEDEGFAGLVYEQARKILDDRTFCYDNYDSSLSIPYEKYIILVNFRDNGIYFSTPIYLKMNFFEYHLDENTILKFDRDDLFFYAGHKICRRNGYLYVNDFGSQYNILGRYGVKNFAVYGRDYIMANGDENDYRYQNIKIMNSYAGVLHENDGAKDKFVVKIHLRGNYIVGVYEDETTAAIAYNKAADTLHENGITKNYSKNYIAELSSDKYKEMYDRIQISKSIYEIFPSK